MSTARYLAVLERLRALGRLGVRPGLDTMREALARLGHPEERFPTLHIAGTNGKGSTATLAEALWRAAGARTGLYTSPHLVRFTERIRIGGAEIAPDEAAALGERVLALDLPLTFFEAATAMAFLAFAEASVDVAVIECGLGGRLDATNLCRPAVTVITSIGLDHTELLGTTLAAIAGEKAGIAKPGVPLLVGPVAPEAEAVIAERAAAVGAPLLRYGGPGSELHGAREAAGLRYEGPGGPLADAALGLVGAHQAVNAALALAATALGPERWRPDERARRAALADVRWPGRLEALAPDLWIDAAHNPEGAATLARALTTLPAFQGHELVLLLGVLADKDTSGILGPLLPLAHRVVATQPASPRALAAEELARRTHRLAPLVPIAVADDPADALVMARTLAQPDRVVVACGSIYLIAAVRQMVTGEPADPVAVADPMPPGRT